MLCLLLNELFKVYYLILNGSSGFLVSSIIKFTFCWTRKKRRKGNDERRKKGRREEKEEKGRRKKSEERGKKGRKED